MRYLVISDIHANLTAFDAILADAEGNYDKIWCLGDVVGYGPHPNECIERLLEFDHVCIAGNHDWAILEKLDINDFNQHARFAILWTQDQLTRENYDYLDQLPKSLQEAKVFTLVHGSPQHPIWEYILDIHVAQTNFRYFHTPYCLVGHTHSPAVFIEDQTQQTYDEIIPGPHTYNHKLNGQRLIINPGSVGQPRDGDARAAYGLLNTDSMTFQIKRVSYQISVVQELMKEYEFPPRLWNRLAFGF